jgi:hypothetical protein
MPNIVHADVIPEILEPRPAHNDIVGEFSTQTVTREMLDEMYSNFLDNLKNVAPLTRVQQEAKDEWWARVSARASAMANVRMRS